MSANSERPLKRHDRNEVLRRVKLSAVVRPAVSEFKQRGGELWALCPFHAENTASFSVNDQKGLYHCLGCGAAGNAIDFVMAYDGVPFVEALRRLGEAEGLRADSPATLNTEYTSARDLQRDIAKRKRASQLWAEAVPLDGTPAEAYLRARGVRQPAKFLDARFHPRVFRERDPHPALLLRVACWLDIGTAVHRTFLNGARKLDGANKMMLGKPQPGAGVWLRPPRATCLAGEGVENVLAVAQLYPDWGVVAGLGRIGLRNLQIPETVRKLVILADQEHHLAGYQAAQFLAYRFAQQNGEECLIATASSWQNMRKGYDFDDLLREGQANDQGTESVCMGF